MAQEFVTGSEFFDIADYSIVENFNTRISIPLERFTAGGHDWVIKFFPQGNDDLIISPVGRFSPINGKCHKIALKIGQEKMQMMNQYRPVEELPDNQNGTDEVGPAENGDQDVQMPLASSGEPKPKPEPESEPEPNSGTVAQEVDASADDSKMEE